MFSARDFRKLIIKNTLCDLGDWSEAAENLLLGTAIQESGLGSTLRCGKRLGVYQIGPFRHRKVWDDHLVQDPERASRIRGFAGQHSFVSDPDLELATNLRYATAIAWEIYRQSGCLLPCPDDIEALASVWRQHFSSQPKGSANSFVENYLRYCGRTAMVA